MPLDLCTIALGCLLSHPSPKALALVQTAAVIADGVTTREFVHRGYQESDPLVRPLIGRYPTYGRMIPLGAAEVVGSYFLAKKFPKWGERVQLSFTVAHGVCAWHNSRLK